MFANPKVGRSPLRNLPSGVSPRPVGRAAGARVESAPRNARHSCGLLLALLPRPRRALTGRRQSRDGMQSGRPGAGDRAPSTVPPPPVSRFPRFAANAASSRDPAGRQQTLCPPAQERSRKVCAAEPTPYLHWGRARPRLSGAGPAGSSAQPGTHRGVATVASARAPRRPRSASASPLGGRGLGALGRGRARGPRLPAVAPGHYRPPVRALRGRSARALRRGTGDN